MVPPMRAESYGQLSRLLLERCDGLARDSYCPRLPDVPVAEVFDEERAALIVFRQVGVSCLVMYFFRV